ncbi:hypothetical protein QR680_011468 [Steinernema hermaphroditum]|uniref:BTB domain-containing protein n=1 Tax=Steinernema hermaphroditum TaxID=289476 RepID=A0AA39I064_9BILA|nr:hypothetical protein QR680_011468 [Steinernema hermaphroditum]
MSPESLSLAVVLNPNRPGKKMEAVRSEWKSTGGVEWCRSARWTDQFEMEFELERKEPKLALCWMEIDYHALVTLKVDNTDSRRSSIMRNAATQFFQEKQVIDEHKAATFLQATKSVNTVKLRHQSGEVAALINVIMFVKRKILFHLDTFSEGIADLKIQLDNGVELFVSKFLLSTYSAFFSHMLYSKSFVEGRTKICKLPGIKYQHFLIVLQRFYGLQVNFAKMTEADLKEVLELANRFQFDVLLSEIEGYVTKLQKTRRESWFDVAERYKLTLLIKTILRNMDINDVKTLCNRCREEGHTNILQKYSLETVNEILNRLCSDGTNN